MTNLDSILKSRDVTLLTKVRLVKAMVFLVVPTERRHFHFSLSCIREGNGNPLQYSWGSLVAQLVKNPPALWEIWIQSLRWEDPLEKGMATHSSISPSICHEVMGPDAMIFVF